MTNRSGTQSFWLWIAAIGLVAFGSNCQRSTYTRPITDPTVSITPTMTSNTPAIPDPGFNVSPAGPGTFTVTWYFDGIQDELLLERKKVGDLFYHVLLDPIGMPYGKYRDNEVDLNTLYQYRIRSTQSMDFDAVIARVTTFLGYPPPDQIQYAVNEDRSIRLTWTDPTGWGDSWRIQRGIGRNWTTVGQVSDTLFVDYPPPDETLVHYRIQSLTGKKYRSSFSDSVQVERPPLTQIKSTTPTEPPPIQEPLPVTMTANHHPDGTVHLNIDWTEHPTDKFVIERKQVSGSKSTDQFFTVLDTLQAGTTEYRDRYPPDYAVLLYRVRRLGMNDFSDISPFVALPPESSSPREFTATPVSDRSIQLNWAPVEWAESYRLERRDRDSFYPLTVLPAEVTAFLDSTCEFQKKYKYRIQAWSEDRVSSYTYYPSPQRQSGEEANSTSQDVPPSIPTISTSFPVPERIETTALSDGRVRIEWDDRTDFEDGFIIERKDATGWREVLVVDRNVTSVIDSTLSGQSKARYRVKAYHGENFSEYAKAPPVSLELRPPANPRLRVNSFFEVEISWEMGTGLETGYRIERRMAPDLEYATLDSFPRTITSYRDTSLAPGNNVQYRVIALGEIQNSHPSKVISLEIPNPLEEMRTVQCPITFVQNSGIIPELPPWLVFKSTQDSLVIFSMLDHEVTNREFLFFCESTDRKLPPGPKISVEKQEIRKSPDKPVVNVTWYDAVDYANWLSTMYSLQPAYDSDYNLVPGSGGFRLPLTLEYLIASHLLEIDPDGNPQMNQEKLASAIASSNLRGTPMGSPDLFSAIAPVRSIPSDQNAVGIFDLLGNVREWCTNSCQECISPLDSRSVRVVRGAGWCDPSGLKPLDACWGYKARSSYPSIGFRLVREVEGSLNLHKWPPPICLDKPATQISLDNN